MSGRAKRKDDWNHASSDEFGGDTCTVSQYRALQGILPPLAIEVDPLLAVEFLKLRPQEFKNSVSVLLPREPPERTPMTVTKSSSARFRRIEESP
ncbi:hypothetical protein Ancab_024355 [Ancistrocladus abbreviatus]